MSGCRGALKFSSLSGGGDARHAWWLGFGTCLIPSIYNDAHIQGSVELYCTYYPTQNERAQYPS